jgi:phospholipid/cholesterol/gamma-HCH transport system permease protein
MSQTTLRGRLLSSGAIWGDVSEFGLEISRAIVNGRVFRYFGEVLTQAKRLVTGSLLVILGMVFTFGLGIGVQGAYAGRALGAPSIAGAFSAVGMLREMGPYAFGYMMAAKVSAGYVAEIGTMRISDEVDALDVMGVDSKVYLCSTRLLASWMVLPFVFPVAIATGFVASYIAVIFQIGDVSPGGYLELFWKFQSAQDLLFSAAKAMGMATFVVLVGCFYGYRVQGGPVEVGRATARAMLINLLGVHAIGIIGSQLFWGTNPRLPIGG